MSLMQRIQFTRFLHNWLPPSRVSSYAQLTLEFKPIQAGCCQQALALSIELISSDFQTSSSSSSSHLSAHSAQWKREKYCSICTARRKRLASFAIKAHGAHTHFYLDVKNQDSTCKQLERECVKKKSYCATMNGANWRQNCVTDSFCFHCINIKRYDNEFFFF